MIKEQNLRRISLDFIYDVLEGEAYLSKCLSGFQEKYAYLDAKERHFLERLTRGTVERKLTLDAWIESCLDPGRRKGRIRPLLRCILRQGAYQILYMDAVPASAACNEAVQLAKKRGFSNLSGFVNGVLRSLARKKEEGQAGPDMLPECMPVTGRRGDAKASVRSAKRGPAKAAGQAAQYAVRYSVPEPLCRRFIADYGADRAEEILASFFLKRPLCIRVNPAKCSREQLEERLRQHGFDVEVSGELPYALYIWQGTGQQGPFSIPEWRDGWFYAQDQASMMPAQLAHLSDLLDGGRILDVCAAPGGKSLSAAMLAPQAKILARDISMGKLEKIQENIERLGVSNIVLQKWDAEAFDDTLREKMDVVFCDLPCSGLGVLSKKPEIRYRVDDGRIAALAEMQRRMLAVSSGYVRPGGMLIYSTCTLTREENEANVLGFTGEHPEFSMEQERLFLPGRYQDGFYAAVLVRQ